MNILYNFKTFTLDTIFNLDIPKYLPIYIITNANLTSEIVKILDNNLPRTPIYLSPAPLACHIKYPKNGFYLIFTDLCDKHLFEHYAVLSQFGKRIIQIKNGIVDINCINEYIAGYFQLKYDNVHLLEDQYFEHLVDINDQNIVDSMREKYNLQKLELDKIKFDRIKFLISRISKTEKLQKLSIFAIYFTSSYFYPQVLVLQQFLKLHSKKSYIINLSDISYERLTCMDGIECAIIFDCEYFWWKWRNLQTPIVIINPWEVYMAWSEWNGDYEVNNVIESVLQTDQFVFNGNQVFLKKKRQNFIKNKLKENKQLVNPSDMAQSISSCQNKQIAENKLIKHFRTGQLIKKNQHQSVSFHVQNEYDDKIYDGYSGIAGNYNKKE